MSVFGSCCSNSKKLKMKKSQLQLYKTIDRYMEMKCGNLKLSSEEYESLSKKYLNMCNQDLTGIDKKSFLESMGILALPSIQILGERVFEAMDKTGNNQVTIEEYLHFMEILFHGDNIEKATLQFNMIDNEKLGYINYKQFEVFLISLVKLNEIISGRNANINKKKAEIKYLFEMIDSNKDGLAQKEEFIQF